MLRFLTSINFKKTLVASIAILLILLVIPSSLANNYEITYNFQTQFWLPEQSLYVSVQPSLYDHYNNSSHKINRDSDYTKFITPEVVMPIAENLKKLTQDSPHIDEQFANIVLKLVQQIPYAITGAKYPVETLIDNSGDCGALSILAASIMKAGGLDVVLIHYTGINPGHMNVGVHLPYKPVFSTWWMPPTSFEYNNKTYWVAEATPGGNWKVGDQPSSVANSIPIIISLENYEELYPAQISTNLGTPFLESSISINVLVNNEETDDNQENNRALKISGEVTPAFSESYVTVYISSNHSYDYYTLVTNELGEYNLKWNFTSAGTYFIRSSFSATSDYAGADSETLAVFIGSESPIQFQTDTYNYIFGQASVAAHELRVRKGIEDFLSSHMLGEGILLSGEFMVLNLGQTTSDTVKTQTITVPRSEQTIRLARSSQTLTTYKPQRTLVTPLYTPQGLHPLRLPDDFNRTINNQFSFVIQNSGANNYSLNVRGLNDYDTTAIKQVEGTQKALMNVSESVNQNTWYQLTAKVSENQVTANLNDNEGALIESMEITEEININELVILITDNTDRVVVFKDLKVETLDRQNQIAENKEETKTPDRVLIAPFIALLLLLIITFISLTCITHKSAKDKKSKPQPKHS
jgi:hypothetical protein